MGEHPSLGHRHLTPGDTFKHGHTLLQKLIAFHINEIGAGQAMLGNKDRLLIPLQIRQEFSGLALEGSPSSSTESTWPS